MTAYDSQPDIVEPDIRVGTKVAIFYSDGCYDSGKVISIKDSKVRVDFLDWVQEWSASDLVWEIVNGVFLLIPTTDGQIIEQF